MNPPPRHGADLLAHMEALLESWRPVTADAQRDIPLLTETQLELEDTSAIPAPMPPGVTRELLRAHVAEACERVMVALYRDLSTDLNERMAGEMRRLVDQGINRATRTLRQQILVSVAESLNRSVERAGGAAAPRTDDPPSKSRP